MKRFYCTICKRVKRVRKLPATMDTPQADKVVERTGVCNLHEAKFEYAHASSRKVAK